MIEGPGTMSARQYTVVRYNMQDWADSAQERAEPLFSPRQDLLMADQESLREVILF